MELIQQAKKRISQEEESLRTIYKQWTLTEKKLKTPTSPKNRTYVFIVSKAYDPILYKHRVIVSKYVKSSQHNHRFQYDPINCSLYAYYTRQAISLTELINLIENTLKIPNTHYLIPPQHLKDK